MMAFKGINACVDTLFRGRLIKKGVPHYAIADITPKFHSTMA